MKFKYENTSLVSSKSLNSNLKKLRPYVRHLNKVAKAGDYTEDEGTINLPSDSQLLRQVMAAKKAKVTKSLKYIIVVGIGGSYFGTKAIYDALYGYRDMLTGDHFPKLIFIDTNDPEYLASLKRFIQKEIKKPSEILVNCVTKSGGTTEPIVNNEIIMGVLVKKFKNGLDRLVITTEYYSKLWKRAKELGVTALPMPAKAGGRFSVLTAVGLFPLAAAGLDIKALRAGAVSMRKVALQTALGNNSAAISAAITYHHYKRGKNINNHFFFHLELESLGKWYRQLMSESVGKEKDIKGRRVNNGITPIISIGSTDLHSTLQLYIGGPKDKYTTFVRTSAEPTKVIVPRTNLVADLVSGIAGKSAFEIMNAIREGTMIAYTKKRLPFTEIVMSEINERTLGKFLQFKMIEMMYLGYLMNVNTFNQPNVESYKIETRRILNA